MYPKGPVQLLYRAWTGHQQLRITPPHSSLNILTPTLTAAQPSTLCAACTPNSQSGIYHTPNIACLVKPTAWSAHCHTLPQAPTAPQSPDHTPEIPPAGKASVPSTDA